MLTRNCLTEPIRSILATSVGMLLMTACGATPRRKRHCFSSLHEMVPKKRVHAPSYWYQVARITNRLVFMTIALAPLMLSGCGGGGTQDAAPNSTLVGVAAAGSPIANGTVTLTDSAGKTLTAVTDNAGNYSFNVAGLIPPFVLQVVPNDPGSMPLYSIAYAQGTANTTPMTNLALYESIGRADLSTAYSSNSLSKVTQDLFSQGQNIVLANFDSYFQQQGVNTADVNLVTSPMAANGQGMDAVLDKITPEPTGGTVYVTSSSGECIPYAPSVHGVTVSIDGMSPENIPTFIPSLVNGLLSALSLPILGNVPGLGDAVNDLYVEHALNRNCTPGLPAESGSQPTIGQSESLFRFIWTRQPSLDQTQIAVDNLKSLLTNAVLKDKDPINVVSHSWGTIIAYIALRELSDAGSPVKVANLFTMGSPVQCLDGSCVKSLVVTSNVPAYGNAPVVKPDNVNNWVNYWSLDDPISGRISAAQNYYVDCDGTLHGDITPVLPPIRSCNLGLDLLPLPGVSFLVNHINTYFGQTSPPVIAAIRIKIANSQAVATPSTPVPPLQLQVSPPQISPPLEFTMNAGEPYCDTSAPAGPAVQVGWNMSVNSEYYRVLRDNVAIGSLLDKSARSFTNNLGLIAGNSYQYTIEAINGAGTVLSNAVSVSIPSNVCLGSNSTSSNSTSNNETPLTVAGITLGPSVLDLGNVKVGNCASAYISVQHVTGTGPVAGTISVDQPFYILSNQNFTVSDTSNVAGVEVGYCPSGTGAVAGHATINSNATTTNTSSVPVTANGESDSQSSPALMVETSTLPDGKVGTSYSASVTAIGGTPPYSWSVVPGSLLPQGLGLDSSGEITGTPTEAGIGLVKVQVSDSETPPHTASFYGSISVEGDVPQAFSLSASPACDGNGPQIILNWSSASGADFYQVYRNGQLLNGVGNNGVNSLTDTSVTLGTAYNYVVLAINGGGGTTSNQVPVTATCASPPGSFTVTVTPTCQGATPENLVSWTGAIGRTNPYQVFRDGAVIATVDTGSYTDGATISGSTHTYFIRASNSTGSTDSNQEQVLAKSDCATPVNPIINGVSPQFITIGNGDFILNVSGQYFDSAAQLLMSNLGGNPALPLANLTVTNGETITIPVSQTSSGYSPFEVGPYLLQVQELTQGSTNQNSNIVQFTVFNPQPTVTSIAGSCRAGFNCTPANGFDVRINGTGFVNNLYMADAGSSPVSSTYVQINGTVTPAILIGQGPVTGQLQLYVNGSLIPTPGTYTIMVCNAGTAQGTQCNTGSLTVSP